MGHFHDTSFIVNDLNVFRLKCQSVAFIGKMFINSFYPDTIDCSTSRLAHTKHWSAKHCSILFLISSEQLV